MTIEVEADTVGLLMATAQHKGDLYITTLARYGRSSAHAEAVDSRPLKVTAFGLRDDAQDAYAAFWRALMDLIDAGHSAYAMELNRNILTLAGEAQRIAIVRAHKDFSEARQ